MHTTCALAAALTYGLFRASRCKCHLFVSVSAWEMISNLASGSGRGAEKTGATLPTMVAFLETRSCSPYLEKVDKVATLCYFMHIS